MKRTLLPYLFAFAACVGATAAPVTRNAALLSAKNFLSTRGLDSSTLSAAEIPSSRSPQRSGSDAPVADPYHIFNLGEGNGFIIVAGDDRAQTILGYSFEGHLSLNDLPDACKAWLDTYAAEIASLPTSSDTFTASAERLTYSSTPVSPMLKSQWDQKDPYNLDCPMDLQTGERAATGCVATVTAQMMYYYRYPERATGLITYDDKTQNVSRTLDFSTLPAFDWANMTPTYGSESSEAERSAVANLMNAAAHATKMQFSSDTSIAYHYDSGNALINYFAYDPAMHFYERAFTTDQEWINIITAELEAGRPVIYNGQNPTIGHAFICDGHDGNGFFHFNWGWSGLSDGYFSLSALDPERQSTGGSDGGYSLNQSIICQIAPKGTPGLTPQTDHLLSIDKLYFRDATQYYIAADNPVIKTKIADAQLFFYTFNKGFNGFTGEVCTAIVTDSSITPLVTVNVNNLGNNGYTGLSFNLSGVTLSDGSHHCGFYYRKSESDSWHRLSTSSVNAPSECILTVKGEDLTFTTCRPDINVTLASDLDISRLFAGATATYSFDLTNTGSVHFEGYAGVALINSAGDYSAIYSDPIFCASGETRNISIRNTLSGFQPGTYTAVPFISYVANPEAKNLITLADPVTVNVESIVLFPLEGSYFLIDSPQTALQLSVSNMSANEWAGTIEGEIVKQDSTVMPGLFSTDVTVGGNGNSTVSLTASGLELEKGTHTVKFYLAPGRDIPIADFPVIVSQDISALDRIEVEDIRVTVESDRIVVNSPIPISACALHDISGRIRSQSTATDNSEISISTAGLSSGIYLLTVHPADAVPVTKKISIRTY